MLARGERPRRSPVDLLRNSKVGVVSCALAASVGVEHGHLGAARPRATPRRNLGQFLYQQLHCDGAAEVDRRCRYGQDRGDHAGHHELDALRRVRRSRTSRRRCWPPACRRRTSSSRTRRSRDTTFMTDAKADITNGAKVILIDPEDPGTGVRSRVRQGARRQDRPVRPPDARRAPSTRSYVSASTTSTVGKLIGQGFVSCAKAWHRSRSRSSSRCTALRRTTTRPCSPGLTTAS